MNILLVGDLHGEYIHLINEYVKHCENMGVTIHSAIQVGDFGIYPFITDWIRIREWFDKLLVPTFVIHGNHEDQRELNKIWSGKIAIDNFCLIKNNTYRKINGLNTYSFGGGFTPLTASQKGVIPWNEDDCYLAIKKWEEFNSPPVDLLITHEAPNGVGAIGNAIFGNPWTAGSKGIRDLWQTIKPKLMICGHYHINYDYQEGDLRLRILGEGVNSASVLDTETMTLTDIRLG